MIAHACTALAGSVALAMGCAAQVTTISALRENTATACNLESCDTPDGVSTSGFETIPPQDDPLVGAEASGGTPFSFASARATQVSTVPLSGPYSATLLASADMCCIPFGVDGEISGSAASTYDVSFELTEPCTVRLVGTDIARFTLASGSIQSRVSIELTGPGNETFVVEPEYDYDDPIVVSGMFDCTRALEPGVYRLFARASSHAEARDDEDASLTTEASITATFECEPPPCPCEFDDDDAQVDVRDLLAYLVLWQNDDPAADFDGGGISIADLLLFLDCWFGATAGGCG